MAMNLDRLERRFQTTVLVMVFCSTNREYGVTGQIIVLLLAAAYAFLMERVHAEQTIGQLEK
jgi:hypothetical protein